jgi:hypothetical protein
LGLGLYFLSPLEIGMGLGKTRTIWVWGRQNSSPLRPIAMPIQLGRH